MNPDLLPANAIIDTTRTDPSHVVTYTATEGGFVSYHRSVWRHAYQAEALAAELRKLPHISGVTVTHSMCGKEDSQ